MTCESCDLNEAIELYQPTGQRLCETCIAAWEHDTSADYFGDEFSRRHQFCTPLRQAVRDYASSPGCYAYQDDDGMWWNRYPSGQVVQIRGHCDHPGDPRCSVNDTISDSEWASLTERLARLSGVT